LLLFLLDLETVVERRRRRMAGHILRMPSNRPAKKMLTWRPEGGRRNRGRPKRTWRNTFDGDLAEMGISWSNAEEVANNRTIWRNLVDQCSEENRRI
jgi:hypothetical protein